MNNFWNDDYNINICIYIYIYIFSYVLVDDKGNILRQHSELTKEKAEQYAACISELNSQARHVVRDLNPKVHIYIYTYIYIYIYIIVSLHNMIWWL